MAAGPGVAGGGEAEIQASNCGCKSGEIQRTVCCHLVNTMYHHAAMVKTLTKHGNSYALVIDRAILELLQIDPDRPVELTTDGNALTIRPMTEGTKGARVARSLKRINDKHGKALKRLGE